MSLEIIAEAAQGYLGDPPTKTRWLVDLAAAAGADAVKFQLVYADELCTEDHRHYPLFRDLEMTDANWEAVAKRCRERKINLYLDVFGPRSLDLTCRLGVYGLKLHSTDVLNIPLIERVAGAPITRLLLSVGGTWQDELAEAVLLLKGKDLVLMHGFQGYPTQTQENQFARLGWLRRQYPSLTLGFADHVPAGNPEGPWLSAVAIGAGATVLEKHITTAVVLREEDSESALNPDDFACYVANMRQAYAAVGEVGAGPDFGMCDGERRYRESMKKHVVAVRYLAAGTIVNRDDLILKRSGATGHVLLDVRAALGRRLKAAIGRDQPIRPEDLA